LKEVVAFHSSSILIGRSVAMVLPIVLGVLAVGVLAFVAVVASRPSIFRVERSATISAPAEAIFDLVNDFHHWEKWSPWAKLDPNAKMTFEGPAKGVGAIQRWEGNSKVGAGSATIIESQQDSLVKIRLEFLRPFKATNIADFVLEQQADQTRVTWTMSGKAGFMSKAFGMFFDCEKMVGKDFEKGLTQMKAVSESSSQSVAA
jgi:hypothetical protein